MKNNTLLLVAISMIASYMLTAQVSINTDGSLPNSSAMVDIKSSTRGFLLPRITTLEQIAISNPATGLLVFNTDSLNFWYFDGTYWLSFCINPNDTIYPQYQCGDDINYGGQSYATVLIGSQCWMAENLATTKYNDGTDIPHVTDNSAWSILTTPAYCWYDNDSATYASTYGALYKWHTADTSILCPTGWHIPTDDEWKAMEMHLGMTQAEADGAHWRGTDEGGKLKEAGTTHWFSASTGATNSSGFTALPGGFRGTSGSFYNLGYAGYWWSATENILVYAFIRCLSYDDDRVYRLGLYKDDGFSVRCIKD